ncbi:hypothetical protein DL96DRAFT_1276081 [Flagelloscypha sp. PMI_526]|nr:hypothetical protein DL96DRAFT_1276081 [Flagelloscypha sp. PMI_526]
MPAPSHRIRVISFDGPALDATGLSELLILEDVAAKWAWDREDDDREGADIRISELCDIVGGTGIGGFYAILFSLNLTVGQVITSQKILQNVLFSSSQWERQDPVRCVDVLKTALAQIVEEVSLEVDLDSPFLSKSLLKCFVCVLNDVTAGRPRALRNYRVRSSKSPHCSIREAIQATLADGVHLPPVRTQDEQFICALSGFPNPSYELMKELPAAFPKGSKLACFVNLGSGGLGLLHITSSKHREELAKHVQNAEEVAQNLIALCGGLGPCYFRFSVVAGVDGSTLESTDDVIRIVKSLTMGYLEEAEIGVHLDAVVDTLTQHDGVVSLERLGSLAAEDGKAKLNAQVEVVHDHVVRMAKAMENDIHRSVKNWLTPIDQTAELDACIRARSSTTCSWLWDHPKVLEWKRTGGIFWCHAGSEFNSSILVLLPVSPFIVGTGKTILASHVIETLLKISDECVVAYYYFEFTNPATLSEEALFRSVISQLSHADNTVSLQLYEQHRKGSLQPQLTTLHKTLRDLATFTSLPVYIIIDALDELPLSGRKYLLGSLLELSPLAAEGVHILATSRDEADIHERFSEMVSFDFAIDKEMVHQDIITFVDQQLAVKKWKSWPKEEVLNMRSVLIDRADGMFRMVACQIEVLNQTQSTEYMRQALTSLPTTLGDTYLYIINAIPPYLRPRAYTLLSVLSGAFVPVSMTELSALVAVELGDPTDPVTLPVYHEGLRYHEPQNIIGLGTALVRRTTARLNGIWEDDGEEILQLAHASVKEYLIQGNCSWCSLNYQLANETIARACLALLIHIEDPKHTSEVADISYTRRNWWKHIHSHHQVQLLSQQKKLFETFPWPRSSIGGQLSYRDSDWESVSFLKSPLIFAAGTGLEQLLFEMLKPPFQWKDDDLNHAMQAAAQMGSSTELFTALIEKGGDVNSTTKDGTPILHNEAHFIQLHVARVLVKYGADVNTVGGEHESALHAAARRGALDIVKFLVDSGADVNVMGYYGSALQAAASQGALGVVEFLVESGADVNALLSPYYSALEAAAQKASLDVVKFLVEKGAYFRGALQASAEQEALDVVKFLVESGANVNGEGGRYGSALQAAANKGDLATVKFLVKSGADINIGGREYRSALQAAAWEGSLSVVKFLVESGADVNMVGGKYGSALHEAACRGNFDIVRFLVENGADVNIGGGQYGSALEAAERRSLFLIRAEKHEMVNFLIGNGAVRRTVQLPLNMGLSEESSGEYDSDNY